MNNIQQNRLYVITLIGLGVVVFVALVLYALRSNINLYYTPTQIAAGEAPKQTQIDVGGLVKKGSVSWKGETVTFVLTDGEMELTVSFAGILPDLFREGQGIVAKGELDTENDFVATQVLAKHDETYMPPEVARSLKVERD